MGSVAVNRRFGRRKGKYNLAACGKACDYLEDRLGRFPSQVNQHPKARKESRLRKTESAALQPFAQRHRFEINGHEFEIRGHRNTGGLQPLALFFLRGSMIDLENTQAPRPLGLAISKRIE